MKLNTYAVQYREVGTKRWVWLGHRDAKSAVHAVAAEARLMARSGAFSDLSDIEISAVRQGGRNG